MIELLTEKEAARRMRFAPGYLRKLRVTGGSPPFIRIGRSIRYRPEDLDGWIERHMSTSTSDIGRESVR